VRSEKETKKKYFMHRERFRSRVGAYWGLDARGRAQARFQLAALIIACCQPLTTVHGIAKRPRCVAP